jgi:tetratricopeptide (TPR) repeat protein
MDSMGIARRISRAGAAHLGATIVVLWITGCASPIKRFEQGLELEGQGHYARAADKYIEALRKDPDLLEARRRLTDVAPQLSDQYLQQSEQYGAANNFVGGAEVLQSLDGFVGKASGVGVPVPLPSDYPETRHSMFDQAIVQLMDEGAALEGRSAWSGAIQRYERVQSFSPDADQLFAATRAGFEAATKWSQADLTGEHFRSAFEHAELAASIAAKETRLDPGSALALREEALRMGTLHVAIAPAWRSEGARAALPKDFLDALNDELEAVYWAQPPLFVAVVDPAWVRREMRQSGSIHSSIDPREARRLGRSCHAEVVVTADIVDFEVQETDVTREQRTAKTRDDETTTYEVRRGKDNYRLRVAYRVLDCRSNAERPQRSLALTAAHDFEQAHSSRNDAELQLTGDERRLFDADRGGRERREAEQRLVEQTAQKLAGQVYRDILTLVR